MKVRNRASSSAKAVARTTRIEASATVTKTERRISLLLRKMVAISSVVVAMATSRWFTSKRSKEVASHRAAPRLTAR